MEKPEQYPNPLIPGSPRSSISPISSKTHGLHASPALVEFPYLSTRGQALSVEKMWAGLGDGGGVCKMGSTLHMPICFLLEGGSMA